MTTHDTIEGRAELMTTIHCSDSRPSLLPPHKVLTAPVTFIHFELPGALWALAGDMSLLFTKYISLTVACIDVIVLVHGCGLSLFVP